MPYQNQERNIATSWTVVIHAVTPNNNVGKVSDTHESMDFVTLNAKCP